MPLILFAIWLLCAAVIAADPADLLVVLLAAAAALLALLGYAPSGWGGWRRR